MDIVAILTAKPVLIGLHLGFAIIGIDAFLWLLGEVKANAARTSHRVIAATIGTIGYALAWIVGGYYYVKFYGPLVKPVIKAGASPWAHTIAMEAKEHIFLFAIPIAITLFLLSRVDAKDLHSWNLRGATMRLAGIAAGLGLLLGALGFIISAAARWGILPQS